MKKEIKCLKRNSKYFPESLRKLENCPEELFVLGDESVLSEFSLSVVGSRRCSFAGQKIAEEICEDLSRLNVVIVSGFARGIDTVAHQTCLDNKNRTIAVLGGGHGKIYPNENKKMIDKILKYGGAIISEYPFEYPSLPKNFIERNRIIAALSEGVILIEAKKHSGSLYTIDYARKLEKKIFAVPGAINDKMYEGSNAVLAEGAFCVCDSRDIVKKYTNLNMNKKVLENKSDVCVDKEFVNLFNIISHYPLSFEEICLKINEPVSDVLYQLTMLEINGLIKEIEGKNFIRIK